MDDPTAELRARVRAGDADAFGAVFDACARSVYNHAFRLTGDWSAAEEIMAATFLEAWRSRAKIAPDRGSLRPWLLGIATNLARGQRRLARRQRGAQARLGVPEAHPDFADDLAGRLDDAARVAALHRALSVLRQDEFEILALCVWSGLGYAEVAEALGIPVGTVRSRLHRARTKLLRLTEQQLRGNSREPSSVRDQLTMGRAIAVLRSETPETETPDKEARR